MIDKDDNVELLNVRLTMEGNGIRLTLAYGPQEYDLSQVI